MTADAFAEHLRRAETLRFDGPDWTCLDKAGDDVFDLGNGGRPLRLHLDADGSPHYVQVKIVGDKLGITERISGQRHLAYRIPAGDLDILMTQKLFVCNVTENR